MGFVADSIEEKRKENIWISSRTSWLTWEVKKKKRKKERKKERKNGEMSGVVEMLKKERNESKKERKIEENE